MRCPDCQKFVGLEFQEPEVEGLDVSVSGNETATVQCQVRLVRTCAECGQELKEASLELETEVEVGKHAGKDHNLQVEEDSVDQIEEGGGRYKKSFFGAIVSFKVTCDCKAKGWEVTGEMSDKVPAGGMDELV